MSKSPSLRRIQADIRELASDPSDRYYASPLEDDMFEWHFTIRGADGTDFEGGIYHGRILLPPEYPFKPPHIMFLTPSGRFETNTKVCLSFSAHHPELWQPAWGIRLILEAIISFLPTPADGAIGALDWSSEERKKLAKQSVHFVCPKCCCAGQTIKDLLPEIDPSKKKSQCNKFAKEIQQLHEHQRRNEANNNHNKSKKQSSTDDDNEEDRKQEQTHPTTATSETATESTDDESQQNTKDAAATSPPTEQKNNPATEQEQADTATSSSDTAVPHNPTPTTNQQQQEQQQITTATPSVQPWISDPVVHAIIVTLAALVVLLYRKMLVLVQELKSLEQR